MHNISRQFVWVYAILTVVVGQCGIAQADVFLSVDTQGIVHLSNVPVDSNYRILLRDQVKPVVHDRLVQKPKCANKLAGYNRVLSTVARRQNLDKALLQAVIAQESAFDPQAVSSKGAVGLMQLMPATAQRYGVSDRYDPEQNIRGGARYLHDLMQQFDNNLPLVLAAYNAGEDAVKHYGNRIPPYAETREYVPRVLGLYRQYRSLAISQR